MPPTIRHTSIAGADTGAVLASTRSAELEMALSGPDAALLAAHLATRAPALPVRLARTWMAGLRAASTEWKRREPLTVRSPVGHRAILH
jgi:hypothetical protein